MAQEDGTIIWETLAANNFPEGVVNTPERWERPLKYLLVDHAESGSLHLAARHGIATEGLTLVCPWAACNECAKTIINTGIKRLVTLKPLDTDTNERWDEAIVWAFKMLGEAGVEVVYVEGPLGDCLPLRRNGQLWHP